MTAESRRRQALLGVALVFLALFTAGQSVYFAYQRGQQQDCFARKIGQLSGVSQYRASLAEQETDATRGVLLLNAKAAGLLKKSGAQDLTPAQQAEYLPKVIDALLHYQTVTTRVQKERRLHPVPSYPSGACDQP